MHLVNVGIFFYILHSWPLFSSSNKLRVTFCILYNGLTSFVLIYAQNLTLQILKARSYVKVVTYTLQKLVLLGVIMLALLILAL